MSWITLVENRTHSMSADEKSGCRSSFKLYGRELLDVGRAGAELHVNQLPLELRVARHPWTPIDDHRQLLALDDPGFVNPRDPHGGGCSLRDDAPAVVWCGLRPRPFAGVGLVSSPPSA